MASRSSAEKKKLVGIRVAPQIHELLELATIFRGAGSMQELLEPVIVEFAESFGSEPEVIETLRQKARYKERMADEEISVNEPTQIDFRRDGNA